MRAAVASVLLFWSVGAGSSSNYLPLLRCLLDDACGVGAQSSYQTLPASEGDLCTLPAVIPCVLGE